VRTANLRNGNSKSCGCYAKDRTSQVRRTHGGAGTRLYKAWTNMRDRCTAGFKQAKDYHERGIRVCDEWQDFETFQKWALHSGYGDMLTLDRIDNDKNYEPGNCRWVTRQEQQGNRRVNNWLEVDGERLCLTHAARRSGIGVSALRKRLHLGWDVERALSEPVRH
jgi:hypothetical protein